MSRNALAVIGSRTRENKYGVTSGTRVADALRSRGWLVDVIHAADGTALLKRLIDNPPELIVPVGYGAPCEDGHVFAAARLAGVPCAGPSPASGGLMQDKSALSRIVDAVFPPGSGVRSPVGCDVTRFSSTADAAALIAALRPPFVIKPAWSGSSERLFVVSNRARALAVVEEMLGDEGKVLVQELEQHIDAEISCTVVDTQSGPLFLPIVQLRRDGVHVLGPEQKFGAEALGRHIVPALLPAPVTSNVERTVLALHRTVGCIGLTRTDILIGRDGEIIVLEMNGIPGLLESSIACDAARAGGIEFADLCVLYAESAFLPRSEPQIWETR